MKIILRMALLTWLTISTSCNILNGGYKYNKGSLPESPVNLVDFNTAYDDYNSTAPTLGDLIPFCFSTNRNSNGGEFDIIFEPMNVNFDKSSGILKVTNEYANWSSRRDEVEIIKTGLRKIKTNGNEFGPNLLTGYNFNDLYFTLMYSTDLTGNAQINYISNKTTESFTEPKEVVFLNSEFDDMYATFNSDMSKIYFCSNRSEENFDFYFVNVDSEKDIELLLSEEDSIEVILDTTLSSNSDDKCPFILDDKMVFTSDREGGFGGFDLYYSILVDGAWSKPINFGETINSEFDEYRPILINEGVSGTQTMMVFSSDRTGGFGGFDLYFVGVENE